MTLRRHVRGLRTLPSFSLEGKTCVVTGAARGLGKEFLTGFSLSGANGACVDLQISDAQSAISSIQSTTSSPPPELRPYACDVTDESSVASTVSQIISDFGRIDVLVTAAGIVDNAPCEEYSFARWRKMLATNLDGTWLFAREVGRHMLSQKVHGSIILIASMSASICVRPQKQAAYNASKGGVAMLARSLATEWGPQGIRVNSLSPGYMHTDLIKGLLEKQGNGKQLVESWTSNIPMGRMGQPSELQGTIVGVTIFRVQLQNVTNVAQVWMASDASSYLNGSDVIVDGGYTAW